ncbi:hypothetical protein CAPTEDRAFT_199488 [Capitella teleta]|uniref:Uncharacterized protein n=1 Tax=Capitella teleta TaxID=283909 RepID=R7V7K1_CAPTE|nr:hypothetical protein CAPTEDRAFT_199488 [Capitella teleta]|eukprot:ELU14534.1 hypothetical protein CAPTEDRAFT_199488 [Capitella teleta]
MEIKLCNESESITISFTCFTALDFNVDASDKVQNVFRCTDKHLTVTIVNNRFDLYALSRLSTDVKNDCRMVPVWKASTIFLNVFPRRSVMLESIGSPASFVPPILVLAFTWLVYKAFVEPLTSSLKKIPGVNFNQLFGSMARIKKGEAMEACLGFFKEIIGNGLISSEGAQHTAQKKLMAPEFNKDSIKGMLPIFSKAR